MGNKYEPGPAPKAFQAFFRALRGPGPTGGRGEGPRGGAGGSSSIQALAGIGVVPGRKAQGCKAPSGFGCFWSSFACLCRAACNGQIWVWIVGASRHWRFWGGARPLGGNAGAPTGGPSVLGDWLLCMAAGGLPF